MGERKLETRSLLTPIHQEVQRTVGKIKSVLSSTSVHNPQVVSKVAV